MGRLNRRVEQLEASYGINSTEVISAEALERADDRDKDLLYFALERTKLKGLIDVNAFKPLLTEDEAAALDRVAALHEELEAQWGG